MGNNCDPVPGRRGKMKSMSRLLLGLLAAAITLLVIYLVWLLLRSYWPLILLCSFLFIGLTNAILELIFAPKQLQGTPQGVAISALAAAQRSRFRAVLEGSL